MTMDLTMQRKQIGMKTFAISQNSSTNMSRYLSLLMLMVYGTLCLWIFSPAIGRVESTEAVSSIMSNDQMSDGEANEKQRHLDICTIRPGLPKIKCKCKSHLLFL